MPRREGRRPGRRGAVPAAEAARLHLGQVQDPHHAERRAADHARPEEHHPQRHAVHVDAGLAAVHRRPDHQPRLLREVVLAGLRQARAPGRADEDLRGAGEQQGVDRKGSKALRGPRLRPLPRRARPHRRHLGADAQGRLRATRSVPPISRGAGRSAAARRARTSSAPSRPASTARRCRRSSRRSPRSSAGTWPTTSIRSRRPTCRTTRRCWRPRRCTGSSTSTDDEALRRRRPAYFPIVGQIMQPGREFHPASTGLTARAVYNESEIAFELSWHDMRAEATGKNGPDIAVPASEDEPPEAAPAASGGGGAWGDAEAAGARREAGGQERERRGLLGRRSGGAPAAPRERVLRRGGDPVPGRRSRRPSASRTSSSATRRIPSTSGSSISPRRTRRSTSATAATASRRSALAVSSGQPATTRASGRWSSSAACAARARSRSRRADSCRSRSRYGTARSRERGNKRGLTNWWTLYFSPAEKPSPEGSDGEVGGSRARRSSSPSSPGRVGARRRDGRKRSSIWRN